MILNDSAEKLFDCSLIDEIQPDNEFPVWKKTDPFGREYYGVSHFRGLDKSIETGSDLSWMEWDGNEVNIDSSNTADPMLIFRKTVGIIKSWQAQFADKYPNERFAILASFDDGSDLVEDSDPYIGFTLRFWKIRDGQGFDVNTESSQPLIKWISE